MFCKKKQNSEVTMFDGVLILFRVFKSNNTWEKLCLTLLCLTHKIADEIRHDKCKIAEMGKITLTEHLQKQVSP